MQAAGETASTRTRDALQLALRLPQLGWAIAAWTILAAVELLPGFALWDVVTQQSASISIQHVACAASLGGWVGLAWLGARLRMSRAPRVAPDWSRLLPALAVGVLLFVALSASLPALARAVAHGDHAHASGAVAWIGWRASAVVCAWTIAAAALWIRAFPQRAEWGGAILFGLAWTLSPGSDLRWIGVAATCVGVAAWLWPAWTPSSD